MRHSIRVSLALLIVALAVIWLLRSFRAEDPRNVAASHQSTSEVCGQVVDADGPVSHARVKIKGQKKFVLTDRSGCFQLPIDDGQYDGVVASKRGYFIGGAPMGEFITVKLDKLPAEDDPTYSWVDPHPDTDHHENCGNCHRQIYDEWLSGAHARSAGGRHLLNLYDGTDWDGNTDRGWNLIADHPDGAGVCNACHAPSLPLHELAFADLRDLRGVSADGVHCDFCHKVQNVSTAHLKLAHGRDAMKILRPSKGQLFFGPLDDVDRGEDVYSPLQSKSQYCSSCHEGIVFGIHVYSTYSEWLESPAHREGKQCQSCHMKPTGHMANIAPESGGIDRDPQTLASHALFPEGKAEMLKRCLKISVKLQRTGTSVQAQVDILAHHVGHRVPTGYIDRHLILVVEPLSGDGQRLAATTGPRLPSAAGEAFNGKPGRLFGKLLRDANGVSPAPFWREVEVAMDTRLIPRQRVESQFTFPATTDRVRVRLYYRRFWDQVAKTKRWPDNEILVYDQLHSTVRQITWY